MMSETGITAGETARRAMVASQLRTSAVNDVRVVAAMATVPREAFVPGAEAALAYRDIALPLPGGRAQNTPLATGRLLTEAGIETGDRVLLIGAAGGYTAAVLAELGAEVTAVESDTALAKHARNALAGRAGVTVIEGELAAGHAAGAPYDILIVDGAVEHLPASLVDQVRAGGRVAAGISEGGMTRLAVGARSEGGFALDAFADLDCVSLPGFARPRTFQFPG